MVGCLASTRVASAQAEVQISNETAPAGATVQVKISLASTRPILHGDLSLNFDPAFFGDVASAAVFSANGDAIGEGEIQGRRVNLHFLSRSAGVGRLASLPVAVIHVPILATIRAGAFASVTATSSATWKDIDGRDTALRVRPGVVTAGGSLAVKGVTPRGDILPAGAAITIEGAGFSAATTADIEGVAISGIVVESSTVLRITLAGPTMLTGKKLSLRNADGAPVQYYFSQSGFPFSAAPAWLPSTFVPVTPVQVSPAWSGPGGFGLSGEQHVGILIQNPNIVPVDVTFAGIGMRSIVLGRTTRTLEGGQAAVFDPVEIASSSFSTRISASGPIRVTRLDFDSLRGVSSSAAAPSLPPVSEVGVSPRQLIWEWQVGTLIPEPKPLWTCSFGEEFDYGVKVTTRSGGEWLSAPATGRSALTFRGCAQGAGSAGELAVHVNPTGLDAGVYNGSLAITPRGENPVTTTVDVTLIVSAQPHISATRPMLHFNHDVRADTPPAAQTFRVETNGSPAEVSVEAAYESGAAWFQVDPPRTTAPADITVSVDPSGLAVGEYAGQITIRGPDNEQTVRVTMSVFTRVIRMEIRPSPSPVWFSWRRGSPAPEPVRVSVGPIVLPVSFAVQADTPPGTWLSAFPISGPGVPGIGVRVDPTQLADGLYRGSLTIRSENPDIIAEPAHLPVELRVWTNALPLTVSPASLEFVAGPGNLTPSANLSITTGDAPIDYTVFLLGEASWLFVGAPDSPLLTPSRTPVELPVRVHASGLLPGSYSGTIRIVAGGNSVDVPVKLTKTGIELSPSGPPAMSAVVSGASQRPGKASPGEIVSLYGFPLGPAEEKSYEVSGGKLTTRLNSTRVLFDGIPAPLLYVSPAQINAIVPYEVAGKSSVVIVVEGPEATPGGLTATYGRSPEQAVPVAAASPALFTFRGTGTGQAAALN
jgi:hypothetical protein